MKKGIWDKGRKNHWTHDRKESRGGGAKERSRGRIGGEGSTKGLGSLGKPGMNVLGMQPEPWGGRIRGEWGTSCTGQVG